MTSSEDPQLIRSVFFAFKETRPERPAELLESILAKANSETRFLILESPHSTREMAGAAMGGHSEDLRRAALLGAGCTRELIQAGLDDSSPRVRDTAAEMLRQWEEDDRRGPWVGLFERNP